jgi:predicted dehydrogenase
VGCDTIGNFDIHAIDAALWITGQRPTSCVGAGRICRPNPQADSHDLFFLTYQCANGLLWSHQSYHIPDHGRGLVCNVNGELASGQISYWGTSFLRGGPKNYGGGEVVNLYEQGAVRNIAAFHRLILEGHYDNPTVRQAVDGVLITILGREAGDRNVRLTMDEILKENKKLEVDLSGLKV